MNHNLLREDEQDIYDSPLGLSLKDVDLLIYRLCEARAEKYEFAAQQLDEVVDAVISGGYDEEAVPTAKLTTDLTSRAAELRRLANG